MTTIQEIQVAPIKLYMINKLEWIVYSKYWYRWTRAGRYGVKEIISRETTIKKFFVQKTSTKNI